jgi:hypothetical protein
MVHLYVIMMLLARGRAASCPSLVHSRRYGLTVQRKAENVFDHAPGDPAQFKKHLKI